MPQDTPGTDPISAAIGGMATFAWYAVPDVVRPRWGRAVAKVAVLTAGVGLALLATRDGRAARTAVRDLQDRTVAAVEQHDRSEGATAVPAAAEHPGTGPAPGGVMVAGGLLLVAGAAVVSERWVHRRAEALGARGWPAPHATVGLVLGAAAAGLAVFEPPARDVGPGPDPRFSPSAT